MILNNKKLICTQLQQSEGQIFTWSDNKKKQGNSYLSFTEN